MAETTIFAVFTKPKDLLSALYHIQGAGAASFPAEVLETVDQRWVLPLTIRGHLDQLRRISTQYEWDMKLTASCPSATRVPIWNILGGAWHSYDPCHDDVDTSREAGTNRHSEDTQYVLAAKDAQQAHHILRALTDVLTDGIRAVPLLLENTREPSPFCFFWVVTMERPCLTVLDAAERAWWGPLGDGRVQCFQQWPYCLDVPEDFLSAIPWGDGARFVLLSCDEPEVVITRRSDGQPTFTDLIHIADFESQECRVLEALALPAERSPLRFTIDLKLIEAGLQRTAVDRSRELRSEIRAKQKLLEAIEEKADPSQNLNLTFEPLFLYYDSGAGIPYQLRRLLLEWSDQEEALRSLHYQKLAASSLPEGVFPDHTDMHILTTPLALGKNGPNDLGIRLWEYAPDRSFDLLPEWAEVGLRLFVPHRQRPALYPDLPVSAVAAAKLARALLPGKNLQNWGALLVPTNDGRIRALQLQLSSPQFKPLLESFEWDCCFDFTVDKTQTAKNLAIQTREYILQGIGHDFAMSVTREALDRLRKQEAGFRTDLEQFDNAIMARQKRVATQQSRAAEHQALVNDLDTIMDRITTLSGEYKYGRDILKVCQHLDWITATLLELLKTSQREQLWQRQSADINSSLSKIQHQIRDIRQHLPER